MISIWCATVLWQTKFVVRHKKLLPVIHHMLRVNNAFRLNSVNVFDEQLVAATLVSSRMLLWHHQHLTEEVHDRTFCTVLNNNPLCWTEWHLVLCLLVVTSACVVRSVTVSFAVTAGTTGTIIWFIWFTLDIIIVWFAGTSACHRLLSSNRSGSGTGTFTKILWCDALTWSDLFAPWTACSGFWWSAVLLQDVHNTVIKVCACASDIMVSSRQTL